MAELQGKFFAHWKGRNPWVDQNLKEIPGFLERAVKNTDHYRYLKRSHGDDTVAIWKVLNTPVKMKVFAWNNPKQEIDTVLSPIDSVRYYKHHLHTGLMSVDPHTGHIKAWVGGINHKYFKFDNVRQSRRQPGSTFKPIVYAAAMAEQAYSPCFEVIDAPQTFVLEAGGTWTARNFGEYTHNTYTLRQALAQSINTVAAFLMRRLKPGTVVDYARKFGITSPLDAVPALALGAGGDVSVYEMVGAYASFVNKGTWIEPTFITHITDKNGKVLYQHIPQKKEVLKEETAYLMTYMLRGATEEKGGTGLGLWRYEFRKNNQVACKTGTTQNYSDGWFMGMTKDLVTGVWVGGEERSIHFRTGDFGQGSRMAMPAYAFYTEKVFADPTLGYTKGEFPVPEEPLSVELNCARYKQIALTDSVIYRMPTGNPLDND
jgi:penicillin-binding protein 1A